VLYKSLTGSLLLSQEAIMKTFGDKIKAVRLGRNRTQEDIAYDLNITVSSYSKIERNVTDVNLSRILQIARVFNMSVAELFSYGEPKSKIEEELERIKKQNVEKDKLLNEKDKLLAEKDKEIMDIQRKLIEALSEKGK
jgi:transcriptional regulator with XRE-family HTH domain